MLTHTFCHLPGIGPKREKQLWNKGMQTWEQALAALDTVPANRTVCEGLRESMDRLAGEDAAYFAARLPASEHYRLFKQFRHRAVFLDIETTGLSDWDDITTIALYDGNSVRYYVRDQNLDRFPRDIEDYGLIITYNGKTFDLPFIRSRLGCRLDQAHIDLRYVLAALGFKGGLKRCEKAMGLDRGDLDGVDGSFAIVLWEEYRRTGNIKALDTLLAYNIEDVINLETLMVRAYNLKADAMGFPPRLQEPEGAANPVTPDLALVNRLKSRLFC